MVYISIILSAYNDAKTIRGCLESVIAQDNADMQMECVVVDDSSTDDTLAVIRRVVGGYSGNIRFRIFRHQTHHGLARTRNTGLQRAEGLYVLFLNAADQLRAGCIDTYMVNLMRHWDADVVAGNTYNVVLKGNLFSNITSALQLRGKGDLLCQEMLRNHLYLYANNKLIRRDLLSENNIVFDESLQYPDITWAFSLFSSVSSIVLLPDITYDFGKHETARLGLTEKWVNAVLNSYLSTCDNLLDKSPRPEGSDTGYYQSYQLFIFGVLNSAENIIKEYNVSNQLKRELSNVRNRLFSQTKSDGQKMLFLYFKQCDTIFSGLFSNPAFRNYNRVVSEVATMLDVIICR